MARPADPRGDRAGVEWARRVGAEYTSAALTAELLHWLIRLGTSPDTLATCHRIVADELAHAELSHAVVEAAGAGGAATPVSDEGMVLRDEQGCPLALRALAVIARVFCCGETAAVPLFGRMRSEATEPSAVAALDRILRDEPVHRAFGWSALEELIELTGEEGRAFLESRTAGWVELLREAYGGTHVSVTAEERRWGLISGDEYTDITERCISEVIVPRFRRHGAFR